MTTEEEREEPEEASKMQGSKIDKVLITLYIDKDVLDWLLSQGGDYEERINKILRDTMLAELQQRKSQKPASP